MPKPAVHVRQFAADPNATDPNNCGVILLLTRAVDRYEEAELNKIDITVDAEDKMRAYCLVNLNELRRDLRNFDGRLMNAAAIGGAARDRAEGGRGQIDELIDEINKELADLGNQ